MLKQTLVILALVAAPLETDAGSRQIDRKRGMVEAAAETTFSVGVTGDSVVAVKVVARRTLVPMVEVVGPDGEPLERGSVKYKRGGHVLKFAVRPPEGARRLVFKVTGRNGSEGSFKAKVQQRDERKRKSRRR